MLFVLLFFTACPNPSSGGEPGGGDPGGGNSGISIDKSFWGPWLGTGNDNEWYITKTQVKTGYSAKSIISVSFDQIVLSDGILMIDSANMLKFTRNDSTIPVYLVRKQTPSNTFTASVAGRTPAANGAARSMAGLAGIQVIVQNMNNPDDTQTLETDSNGDLAATETLLGEDYQITIPVQDGVEEVISAEVTPYFDHQDLGIVNIMNNSANFKMNWRTNIRPDLFQVGESHRLFLDITNIGDSDMDEAEYEITSLDGLTFTRSKTKDIIGTIFVGETKTLVFDVESESFAGAYKDCSFQVSISDIYKTKTWTETLYVRFLQTQAQFKVLYSRSMSGSNTASHVNGYVIDPDGLAFSIDETYNWKNGKWYVVVGPYPGDEGKYGVAYGDYAHGVYDLHGDYLDTASYGEPNNTFETASPLQWNTPELQYIGAKDIDIYTFELGDVGYVTFDANGADSGSTPANIPYLRTNGDVSLPGNSGNLKKNGYVFGGWIISNYPDGTINNAPVKSIKPYATVTSVKVNWLPDDVVNICVPHSTYIVKDNGDVWRFSYDPNWSSEPLSEIVFSNTIDFSFSGYETYWLDAENNLMGEGSNQGGQLGLGHTNYVHNAVEIIDNVKSYAGSRYHLLVLKNDGTVWAAGNNGYGELGDGTTNNATSFIQVFNTISNISQIFAGCGSFDAYSFVLTSNGDLYGVGLTSDHTLGTDSSDRQLTPLHIFSNVKDVSTSEGTTLVLFNDGTVQSFGKNDGGQLGHSFSSNIYSAAAQQIATDAKAVFTGPGVSFVLKNDGTLLGCGYNYYGTLGLGHANQVNTLTEIMGGVKSVSSSGENTLFLMENGEVYGVGQNGGGQLGTGDQKSTLELVKMY